MPPIESVIFIIVFTMLGVAFLIIGKVRYSTIINPVSLFSVLWMIIGVGSNLCLYGYYPPSTYVNNLILVGAIVFCIVSIALRGGSTGFSVFPDGLCGSNAIRTNLIILVNLICIIYMVPILIKAVGIIVSDGWGMLRFANYNEDLKEFYAFMPGITIYLYNYLIKPCGTVTFILSLWMLVGHVHKAKTIFVLGALQIIMDVLITAGRAAAVYALFYTLMMFLLSGKGRNIVTALKKILKPKFFAFPMA